MCGVGGVRGACGGWGACGGCGACGVGGGVGDGDVTLPTHRVRDIITVH